MRDEPENERRRGSMPRVNEIHHGKPGAADASPEGRVRRGQSGRRVHAGRAGCGPQLQGGGAASTTVPEFEQKPAGHGASPSSAVEINRGRSIKPFGRRAFLKPKASAREFHQQQNASLTGKPSARNGPVSPGIIERWEGLRRLLPEPTPSPRLWATPSGATPARMCEHTMWVFFKPAI